jgi:hypothetical protein
VTHRLRATLAAVPPPPQGTEERVTSRDRARDALGAYPALSRLEETHVGRLILEATTDIGCAVRQAFKGMSSTEWSEETGFRSPGDYRKLSCFEHLYNVADLGTLRAIDRDAYCELLMELASQEGIRCEPSGAGTIPIGPAIGRLQKEAANLTNAFLEAERDHRITPSEREQLRDALEGVKRLAAEVEVHVTPGVEGVGK